MRSAKLHNLEPEWVEPSYITQFFSIGRTCVFRLIQDKKIESKLLNIKGNPNTKGKGKRLIKLQSVRDYINSQPD